MKAIWRLFKEADKQKEILSANRELNIKIPEIMGPENDLNTKLTWDEFESSIKPIIEWIDEVLDRVFSSPYIADVTDVELLGGGLRVPLVKKHLESWLKQIGKSTLPLGSHMNSDEAMAFGAGYMASNYSSSYKVPKVYMYQHVTDTVYLNVSESNCKSDDCFTKNMTLFSKGVANLGSKKTISISNHFGNLEFSLYTDKGLLITGKAKLTSSIKEKADRASEKKLALVFKYDRSGILSITWAEAILKEGEKENTYQMEVTSEFHGPKSMTRQ